MVIATRDRPELLRRAVGVDPRPALRRATIEVVRRVRPVRARPDARPRRHGAAGAGCIANTRTPGPGRRPQHRASPPRPATSSPSATTTTCGCRASSTPRSTVLAGRARRLEVVTTGVLVEAQGPGHAPGARPRPHHLRRPAALPRDGGPPVDLPRPPGRAGRRRSAWSTRTSPAATPRTTTGCCGPPAGADVGAVTLPARQGVLAPLVVLRRALADDRRRPRLPRWRSTPSCAGDPPGWPASRASRPSPTPRWATAGGARTPARRGPRPQPARARAAYLALLVGPGVVAPERVLRVLQARGRGI